MKIIKIYVNSPKKYIHSIFNDIILLKLISKIL